jgi:hypothetical protein
VGCLFLCVEELASARQDFKNNKQQAKCRGKKELNMINFIVRALQRETALFILPRFLLTPLCSFLNFIFGHKTAKQFSRTTTLLMLAM